MKMYKTLKRQQITYKKHKENQKVKKVQKS